MKQIKAVPSYGKILTLGSTFTERALEGEVVAQEKVDGSFFGFGLNEDAQVVMRSKGSQIDAVYNKPKMFSSGIDYITSISKKLQTLPKDTYFYAEYLEKPKHNTLSYANIPLNHLVLFDVHQGGTWLPRPMMLELAMWLKIDLVPQLYAGMLDHQKIKELLDNGSFLGDEKIEGVVIKNYNQTVMLGGKPYALFTKYVREEFKERNGATWKTKKGPTIVDWLESFKTDARWLKALQHLRDSGELENEPRDIGKLVRFVEEDILLEETENIKNELYRFYKKDILKHAVRGLPEWYKDKLMKRIAV